MLKLSNAVEYEKIVGIDLGLLIQMITIFISVILLVGVVALIIFLIYKYLKNKR